MRSIWCELPTLGFRTRRGMSDKDHANLRDLMLVRNPRTSKPISAGWLHFLLLFLANALALGTVAAWAGFVLAFVSCWIKLNQEEALMLRLFPAAYPAYRARTSRLAPYLF